MEQSEVVTDDVVLDDTVGGVECADERSENVVASTGFMGHNSSNLFIRCSKLCLDKVRSTVPVVWSTMVVVEDVAIGGAITT